MGEFRLIKNTTNVINFLDRMSIDRMNEVCLFMQGQVQETLTGPRHGRVYRVPGTKGVWRIRKSTGEKYRLKGKLATYVASAPGEAPASPTARLRKSIKYKVEGNLMRGLKGYVGTDLDYAVHLEKGTKRMAARPFLRPTFERNRLKIKEILGRKYEE